MMIASLLRRGMIAIASPMLLAACASTSETLPVAGGARDMHPQPNRYAALTDEPFPVAAVPASQLKTPLIRI